MIRRALNRPDVLGLGLGVGLGLAVHQLAKKDRPPLVRFI